jgi:hypothetical protein
MIGDVLRIELPSERLTFSKLAQLNIPAPPNGFDREINDSIILSFENEQEAIDYSLELDRYANSQKDHNSAEYLAATEVIRAINEDEFVRTYNES